jgi:hypothetical protein
VEGCQGRVRFDDDSFPSVAVKKPGVAMGDGMISPHVNVKTLVGQQMLEHEILPKLAEGKADVFPFLFGCPRLSPGTKANDPAA